MFYTPNLLGGQVEYDMDLSQSSCSCNAALYLVSMPGKDWNGNPDPSSGGDYYCDANKVGGVFCTEIDIMEANTYAWQTTPHNCDAPTNKGHYNNCDGSGKGWMNFHNLNLDYGPGRGINTQQKFHVKSGFQKSGDRLTRFSIELSQNGHTVSHSIGDGDVPGGYFDSIKGDLERGMTFAISNWGSDWNTMQWLDGNTGCGGGCGNPSIHVSNISITTGGHSPTPTPTPTPGTGKWSCADGGCSETGSGSHDSESACLGSCTSSYSFGDACAGPSDGLCGSSCGSCAWSWPSNDPQKWSSSDANCRCKSAMSCKEKYWSNVAESMI